MFLINLRIISAIQSSPMNRLGETTMRIPQHLRVGLVEILCQPTNTPLAPAPTHSCPPIFEFPKPFFLV
eukprot:m.40862 g.40862  ORF g.40862 m.40862 type:complete len:69 (-) comp10477_c0_seq1:1206-1412(-)